MNVRICRNLPQWWCRACTPVLALSWSLGLFAGVFFGIQAGPSVLSLMRAASVSRVSIVGLLICNVLPFLISAFAVSLQRSLLLPVIAFLKAFSFGFCAMAIVRAFGTAGWLVGGLLLFSDCLSLPALCWFWLRQADGRCVQLKKDLITGLLVTAIAGILDCCLIAPFLVHIIEF